MSADTRRDRDIATFAILASQAVTLIQKSDARTEHMMHWLTTALQMFKENVLGGVLNVDEFKLWLANERLAKNRLEFFEFSSRTSRQLKKAEIKDVLTLIKMSDADLTGSGVNIMCIAEIIQVLELYSPHLHLGMTELEIEKVRKHGTPPSIANQEFQDLNDGDEFIHEDERFIVCRLQTGHRFGLCLTGKNRTSLLQFMPQQVVQKLVR